ncbi:hypothetical protein [Aedoeadaptatus coxii]|uniref:hypothetical protein n=1 Tax=Aedoeadaptatus coxii TaxID=755172 RepID=UPI002AD3EE26|nr:hypothetical protein [Peptoniphilus coxii]
MQSLVTGAVVNVDGFFADIVAFDPESKEIESYELKDGEVLIESVPEGFLKPFYNFVTKMWEEGAAKEEIAEHENALEEEKQKREEESKQKGPAISTAELMLGMTSMYEEMLKKDAENKMALAEIYELELNK